MKRIVKAAADPEFDQGVEIKNRILEAANRITEPTKFYTSSSVITKGAKAKDTIRLSIASDPSGYTCTLDIGDGARFTLSAYSFSEAKHAFNYLADKYIRYSFRWRGRKLTDEEYRDLTNGL